MLVCYSFFFLTIYTKKTSEFNNFVSNVNSFLHGRFPIVAYSNKRWNVRIALDYCMCSLQKEI